MSEIDFFTKKRNVVILALIATILWGIGYPSIKICYELFHITEGDFSSKILLAGIRFIIAGLLVLLFSYIFEKKSPFQKYEKPIQLIVLSLLQTILQYSTLYIALAYIEAGKSSILNQFGSFMLVICSQMFFREDKFSIRKIIGGVIGISGIILINWNANMTFSFRFIGEGLILFSSIFAALGYVVSKKVSTSCNPIILTGRQQLLGGIVLSIIGYFSGGRLVRSGIGAIIMLLFLAVIIAVAFVIWVILLKFNTISEISVYKFAVPIFAVFFSGILLNENVWNVKTFLSLFLVCCGIIVVNINQELKIQKEGTTHESSFS